MEPELDSEIYDELRKIASIHLHRGTPSPSLQPTLLVHEAWLRLAGKKWQGKTHFLASASGTMRNVLIDAIRRRCAEKRGGGQEWLELTPDVEIRVTDLALPVDQLLELDLALTRLGETDPRKARVVEMRFFGGMEHAEIAEALDISVATVKRDWEFSRSWLYSQLTGLRHEGE